MAGKESKQGRTVGKSTKATKAAPAAAPGTGRASRTTAAVPPAAPAPRRARAAARATQVAGFDPAALLAAVAPRFDALTREVHDLKRFVQPPVTPAQDRGAAGDAALEASVDALRRVLGDAIEQRVESVVRELVEVRREVAASDAARAGARLERLLDTLGAVRFTAEPMDLVDPLIHVVVDERRSDSAPDGVVLETVRPGYRTARGAVVSQAAVVVNRRS